MWVNSAGHIYSGDCLPDDRAATPDEIKTWAQKMVWSAIKNERERRKSGGVQVGGKWFHTDADSRIQLIALAMLGAGIPAGLQWKTMDGSKVGMTQTLAQQVFAAVVSADNAIFTTAETHRIAMEASAEPSAYNWHTGWPLVYGEAQP